jgi:phosphonate transport system substrate-binding protein
VKYFCLRCCLPDSHRRIILFLLLIAALLQAASACRQQNAQSQASPAPRRLLIGLVPEESMFKQIERYEPLIRYLSDRTGFDIRLTVLPRYENILTAFSSQKMDAAFFGSLTYVLAHSRIGVRTIARPERPDGKSTYHGIIIVRADSGIRSVRDMRGRRFAFASRDTIAGYVLPLVYFRKAGVNYRSYLKESYFTGTHEDVIRDVLDGKADAGAAKNTALERLAAQDPEVRKKLWVLELAGALLTLHEDPSGAAVLKEFGAARFIESREADYRPVVDYVRQSGLKMESLGERSVR